MPISARSEYSSVLKLKLKTTTSGNCRAAGTCDWRGGVDLTGVKADDGKVGGEAAERRAVVLTGVGNLGGGVLTTFALGVSLDTDCDLAGRAMAADGDGEDGRLICGTLSKMALTRIRNMNDWREEGAEWSGPASSFSLLINSRVGTFVLFCPALVNPASLVAARSTSLSHSPATTHFPSLQLTTKPTSFFCDVMALEDETSIITGVATIYRRYSFLSSSLQ